MLNMKMSLYLDRRPRGTAAKLASAAGITPVQISRYLRGDRRPSPEVAAQLSVATNGKVSIIELLYPEGIPPGAKIVPDEWVMGGVIMPLEYESALEEDLPPMGDDELLEDGPSQEEFQALKDRLERLERMLGGAK